jgi:GNAT superfamily N-acetyltransferase
MSGKLCLYQGADKRLDLRLATGNEDAAFAHDLTRANMHAYVAPHWGGWDRAIFFDNYALSENWLAWHSGERVGLARLVFDQPVLVIEDLQVLATEQNKGYGTEMLADLTGMARRRGCERLRLRVFDENPARRLYLRFGFVEVQRDDAATWLEMPLD